MNKYAQVALKATHLLNQGVPAPEAWKLSAIEVFPDSITSQEKGCPKSTFLGLCEETLIKGSSKGSYTRSKLNKEYALKALRLLKANSPLSSDAKTLWNAVVSDKTSNSQMDVVIALWEHDLLNKEKV